MRDDRPAPNHGGASVESGAKKFNDALKELLKSVTEGSKQVETYIETQRKAAISNMQKDKEDAVKERIRLEKAAEKAAAADAKKLAKTSAEGAGDHHDVRPSVLFSFEMEGVEPSADRQCAGAIRALTTFKSPEDFQHAKLAAAEGSDFQIYGAPTEPYMIEKCRPVEEICADKAIKSAQGIFNVQFGMSNQAKTDKKGQIPLTTPRNDHLREVVYGYGPKIADLKMSGPVPPPTVAVRNFIKSVSHYAQLPSCIHNGETERFGLPSWRYQSKGTRQVAFVSYDHLRKFFDFHSACEKLQIPLDAMIRDVLATMSAAVCKDLLDSGAVIYRGEVFCKL